MYCTLLVCVIYCIH